MNNSIDKEILSRYNPNFAITYGSGAIGQKGYTSHSKPMIDYIFGVHDTQKWHNNNIKNNQEDYSGIIQYSTGKIGKKLLNILQNTGAKIYYNHTNFGGTKIKYGVISIKDLIDDLNNWTDMYSAGRLQKPVNIIKSNDEVNIAIQNNYDHATKVAIVLLDYKYEKKDLYKKITSLSYINDSRMKIAEDPRKIENIVMGNIDGFDKIYEERVEKLKNQKREDIIKKLPKNLKEKINTNNNKDIKTQINEALGEIINKNSKIQTVKGLCTVPIINSLQYGYAKIKKRFIKK